MTQEELAKIELDYTALLGGERVAGSARKASRGLRGLISEAFGEHEVARAQADKRVLRLIARAPASVFESGGTRQRLVGELRRQLAQVYPSACISGGGSYLNFFALASGDTAGSGLAAVSTTSSIYHYWQLGPISWVQPKRDIPEGEFECKLSSGH